MTVGGKNVLIVVHWLALGCLYHQYILITSLFFSWSHLIKVPVKTRQTAILTFRFSFELVFFCLVILFLLTCFVIIITEPPICSKKTEVCGKVSYNSGMSVDRIMSFVSASVSAAFPPTVLKWDRHSEEKSCLCELDQRVGRAEVEKRVLLKH